MEATLPNMNVEPSQGSHFFHNLSSFQVSYFTVGQGIGSIDWSRMKDQVVVNETDFLAHVRLPEPLLIRVDGRTGRGVIRMGGPPSA